MYLTDFVWKAGRFHLQMPDITELQYYENILYYCGKYEGFILKYT